MLKETVSFCAMLSEDFLYVKLKGHPRRGHEGPDGE